MIVLPRLRAACACFCFLLLPCTATVASTINEAGRDDARMQRRIDDLLARMTLEEKVGQLSILGADHGDLETLIREGRTSALKAPLSAHTPPQWPLSR